MGLDFIRGFAVLGILLANISAFAHNSTAYYWPPALPGGASESDGWLWLAQFALVDGKFRGLFAVLFGAGLVLFAERASVAGRGHGLQLRRLSWLALFGLAHFVLLFSGDILFMYATAGFVALLFLQLDGRPLFVTGALWALAGGLLRTLEYSTVAGMEAQALAATVPPESWAVIAQFWQASLAEAASEAQVFAQGSYADVVQARAAVVVDDSLSGIWLNFYETIPQMLIGMGLYKMGIFTDSALRRRWRKWAIINFLAGVALLALAGWTVLRQDFPPFQTQYAFFARALVLNLPVIVGATLLLADWAQHARDSWLGERLAAAGRMAFSNYVGTSLVMSALFQGWGGGLFGQLHRAELLLAVALGWALMIVCSRLWLARFRYGPLEWLWRCLTYWQVFPMRRGREPN